MSTVIRAPQCLRRKQSMKGLALIRTAIIWVLLAGLLALPVVAGQSEVNPNWSADGPLYDSTATANPVLPMKIPAPPNRTSTTAIKTTPKSPETTLLNTAYAPGDFGLNISYMSLTPVDSYLTGLPWRVSPSCSPYWAAYQDSSIAMHAHVLDISNGWPHLTDGVGDSGNIFVDPHEFWMAFTPLGTPEAQGPCDENIHIVAGPDGISYSNQVGPNPGDTIANPIFSYEQFHMPPTDTIFWYFDTDYSNGRDDGWPIDTGRYDIDSVGRPGYADTIWLGSICTHLADPDLFIDGQGNLWVAFMAAYAPGSRIFVSHSADGINWSTPVAITRLGYWVCPSIVDNGDGTFSLFVLHIYKTGFYERALYRFQSAEIEKVWGSGSIVLFSGGGHDMDTTTVTMTGINGDSCFIWHYDVVPFDPGQWFVIYSGRYNSQFGDDRWLGAGMSLDHGASFDFAQTPLATAPIVTDNAWDSVPYAPSGYFTHNESDVVFRAYLSSRGSIRNNCWHTGTYNVYFYNIYYSVDGVVFLIDYVFRGGVAPYPMNRGDINGDCQINVADAIYLINYIFKGGPPPMQGCVE